MSYCLVKLELHFFFLCFVFSLLLFLFGMMAFYQLSSFLFVFSLFLFKIFLHALDFCLRGRLKTTNLFFMLF
ncbi:hypothetical protein D3C87_1995610 [compost metagenome]